MSVPEASPLDALAAQSVPSVRAMGNRKFYFAFGAALWLLALFFHGGGGWNPNSRLLTVFGLVEDGTFRADRWKGETGDYAQVGGHLYSDKAPGSSFVVLPFYWVMRRMEGGAQTGNDRGAAVHLGDAVASALPFAIFALLLLLRVEKEGVHGRAAVWLGMAGALGTCLFDYGGLYFGHMLAAALFLGAYVLACEREERFVLAGALGGLAVLTEYPLAVTQIIVLVYLLLGPQRWRRATLYGLGALPMALLMIGYNKAITGGWFDFPYSHVGAMWAAMHTDFGMRLPNPSAMWALAFGQYRGLAFYAPVLLLGVPAIAAAFAGPRRRKALVLVLLGSYFLLISSYFKWDGGWCVGPRHLLPVIALGVYEGTAALARTRRHWWLHGILAGWGALVAFAALATDPLPAENFRSPAFEVFFPKVWKGQISGHNLLAEAHLPNGRYVFVTWLTLAVALTWALAWWAERREVAAANGELRLQRPVGNRSF